MKKYTPIQSIPFKGNFTCISPYYASPVALSGFPCNKCPACYNRRRMEWVTRMMLEHIFSRQTAFFITLTYADSNDYDKKKPARNIQLMNKLLNYQSYNIRYCYTTEFGSKNGRVHHHGIMWANMSALPWFKAPKKANEEFALKYWKKGYVKIRPIIQGKTNPFAYTAKYLLKDAPRVIHSNKPRIGHLGIDYIKNYVRESHKNRPYKLVSEFPKSFPFEMLGHKRKIYMLNSTRMELAKELGVPFVSKLATLQSDTIKIQNSIDQVGLVDPYLINVRK